ncbi:MAG: hypothetical protein Rpha_1080 [Candidatus Ruthia sp. Apha_13_S6]|nr:hypothetical protein [Candidatus Ruthia sp. Apha_13_S6]
MGVLYLIDTYSAQYFITQYLLMGLALFLVVNNFNNEF